MALVTLLVELWPDEPMGMEGPEQEEEAHVHEAVAPQTMVAIENGRRCPEGSTATKKCCVLTLGLRTS